MDTTTTIIGLALLAIGVLPFVFLGRKRKKIEKKYMQTFLSFVEHNGCTVSKKEQDGNMIIGLDEHNNRLFFLSTNLNEYTPIVVDLNFVKSSTIVKTKKEGVHDDEGVYGIAKIELCFIPAKLNQQTINLEIFDAKKKAEMSSEMLFAREWTKIINDHIETTVLQVAI